MVSVRLSQNYILISGMIFHIFGRWEILSLGIRIFIEFHYVMVLTCESSNFQNFSKLRSHDLRGVKQSDKISFIDCRLLNSWYEIGLDSAMAKNWIYLSTLHSWGYELKFLHYLFNRSIYLSVSNSFLFFRLCCFFRLELDFCFSAVDYENTDELTGLFR